MEGGREYSNRLSQGGSLSSAMREAKTTVGKKDSRRVQRINARQACENEVPCCVVVLQSTIIRKPWDCGMM